MRTFTQKTKAARRTASPESSRPGRAHPGQASEAGLILHLQRTIGNQVVQRCLEENVANVKVDSTVNGIARSGCDLNRIPMHNFVAGAIETRLAINKPGDEDELEADRIADRVMRMEGPAADSVSTPARRGGAGGEILIQARAASGVGAAAAPGIQPLQGGGRPLGASERSFFEPRFGTDFSGVRVHHDSSAADMAQSVNALAFTLGKDIVFNAGQYAPGTDAGLRLLAHELTHTLQQGGGGPAVIRRYPNSITMAYSQPLAGQGSKNYLAGILTEMYVGSNQTCDEDYNGEKIEEDISTISDTCSKSLASHTATFIVGSPYSSNTFGQFPAQKNIFYDAHVMGFDPAYLPAFGGKDCSIVNRQIYKHNGKPIAEFKLTRTAGRPGAGNKANLTTVKTEVKGCLSCP